MHRRRVLTALAIIVLAGLALLTPTGHDPEDSVMVRRYLANLGYQVTDDEALPPRDRTLVLLHDARGDEEAAELLAWAAGGGTLVVADPASAIVDLAGAARGEPIGLVGNVELTAGCVTPAVVGVKALVARASDTALVARDDTFISCFPAADGAFLLSRPHGDGTVTLLGGGSPFANGLLIEADNAVLAAQLVGPARAIVFGPPSTVATAQTGVWENVPDRGRAAIIVGVAAALAIALVRGRRLGRPLPELPVSPIPGNELVRAAGRMYRRANAPGYAGRLMRAAGTSRLARQVRATSGDPTLAELVSRASGLPPERVAEILGGPDPRTDEELIGLGQDLEDLAARAGQGAR
jgi:hypothetical protein